MFFINIYMISFIDYHKLFAIGSIEYVFWHSRGDKIQNKSKKDRFFKKTFPFHVKNKLMIIEIKIWKGIFIFKTYYSPFPQRSDVFT